MPETVRDVRELSQLGKGNVDSLAWSPNNDLLALSTSKGIYLLEKGTFVQVGFLPQPASAVDWAFTPEGDILVAAGYDSTVRLWKVQTGELLHTIKLPRDTCLECPPLESVVVSSDDRMVAMSSFIAFEGVGVWDMQEKQVRLMQDPESEVSTVLLAFSPDGTWLLGLSSTLVVWEVETGNLVYEFDFGDNGAYDRYGCAVSPDGQLFARAMDYGTVEIWGGIWDIKTLERLRVLDVSAGTGVCGVAFSPDSKILAAQVDKKLQLWDMDTGALVTTQETGIACGGPKVAFNHDGSLLAYAGRHRVFEMQPYWSSAEIYVWDISSDNTLAVPWEFGGDRSRAFSPTGEALAIVNTIGEVWTWRVSGSRFQKIGQNPDYRAIHYSPDGGTLAVAYDSNVQLIDANSGQIAHELEHSEPVKGLAYAPDGTLVVWIEGDELVFWSPDEEMPAKACQIGAGTDLMSLSRDGKWAALAKETTVELWKTAGCKRVHILDGHEFSVWQLEFSPDGNTLATGGVYELRLWNVQTGDQLLAFEPELTRWAVHFEQGKSLVAVVKRHENDISIFDGEGGALLSTIPSRGVQSRFTTLQFSPDGQVLVTCDESGRFALWDVQTGNLVQRLEGITEGEPEFSPDGHILASV
ncbi:MAG: hypothetical protein JXA89_19795 [Anaerolineae bacterium]|nr:hypothetical protein [Anaerolineae bacterium]